MKKVNLCFPMIPDKQELVFEEGSVEPPYRWVVLLP